MIVLYIIGAILALAALLLLILLLLPLDVALAVGNDRKLAVSVRVLGMSFGGEEESCNPLVRFFQKHLKSSSEPTPKPTKDKQESAAIAKENIDLLIPLIQRLCYVLRHCRVSQCAARCVSGGDDAAMQYGELCATVYPFVGYLQNCHRLRKRNTHMDIGWDYDAPDSTVDLTVAVRVRVFFLAAAALPLAFQYFKRKGESV
ncbi:MAG: hypothetical protein IJO59_03920 [Clostridia bacterium]|nr:hypothetical protein [Clostridia bacterium]